VPLEPTDFYRSHLRSLHVALLRHPIGIAHLSGRGIRLDGRTLVPGELIHGMDRMISTLEFAHLFTVFNGSRVHAQFARKPLHDAPAGLYFSIINNGIIQSPNKNRLGLYRARDKHDSTLIVKNMHIDCICLAHHAPPGLGTIAFALSAITAHLAGLSHISLVAAGGPGARKRYVGYRIWPKFGFDADIASDELAAAPYLQGCQTIQKILARDPAWWDAHGTQRMMLFDLAPHSTSWGKLLRYVRKVFNGGSDEHRPFA